MYSKVIFLLNITVIEQFDMVLNRLEEKGVSMPGSFSSCSFNGIAVARMINTCLR